MKKPSPADLARRVLTKALLEEGFDRRSEGILTIPTAGGFNGWLGLNIASGKGIAELNLIVGLRSEQVESIVGELVGHSPRSSPQPTISVHIGYLMPQRTYHPWYFSGEPTHDETSSIIQGVRRFAIPFMRDNSDLNRIVQLLGNGLYAPRDRAMYRLPVCRLLFGELVRVKAICDEFVREIGDRHDAAAEEYRRFVAALKARFLEVV